MSHSANLQLSQGSLAPPAEITGPATPIQRGSLSASPELSAKIATHNSLSDNNKFLSPPSLPSSDMTPPPSSQIPGAPLRRSRSRSGSYLASPPDIEKTLCVAYGASENLPSAEDIDTAEEPKLRTIAKDLLGITQEARMSALHFKLQNSLLSFTSNEAIKRAEVEHKLARREVEILQSSEYRGRHVESKPPPQITNVELDLAIKRSQELERVNATLDRRLRRAKKLIEQEKNRSDLLAEENNRLKKRIRDNREHFSLMIEHGSLSPSPQIDTQPLNRKSALQFADSGNHDMNSGDNNPFAALLAADRVLNRESSSVASTPNRTRAQRHRPNGHVRGNHSMSSLPMTPSQIRIAHQEKQYFTPGRDSQDEHRDRDSTISASDIEEAETEEDVPVPQSRPVLNDKFHHNPPNLYQEVQRNSNAPRSSSLLQTKLFGQVRKAGVELPSSNLKRKASFDGAASKKSRAEERVGLGIDTWNDSTTPA